MESALAGRAWGDREICCIQFALHCFMKGQNMTVSTCTYVLTAVCVVLASSMLLGVVSAVGPPDEMSAATARAEIEAMYKRWGRARVSLDEETIEAMLDDAFYVLIDDRRISREEFVKMVLRKIPTRQLTRFDTDVLTVQRAADGWTVVITEKLEVEVTDAEGKTHTRYSFWVTRDGCRKEGDTWMGTYSEAIGYENWRTGKPPPIKDW